jgi:hypothetical protein
VIEDKFSTTFLIIFCKSSKGGISWSPSDEVIAFYHALDEVVVYKHRVAVSKKKYISGQLKIPQLIK